MPDTPNESARLAAREIHKNVKHLNAHLSISTYCPTVQEIAEIIQRYYPDKAPVSSDTAEKIRWFIINWLGKEDMDLVQFNQRHQEFDEMIAAVRADERAYVLNSDPVKKLTNIVQSLLPKICMSDEFSDAEYVRLRHALSQLGIAPSLDAGTVECLSCGSFVGVEQKKYLAQGWPSCCGAPMTVKTIRENDTDAK